MMGSPRIENVVRDRKDLTVFDLFVASFAGQR